MEMETLNKLTEVVIKQSGMTEAEFIESAEDFRQAEDGFNGFIYFHETLRFWEANKDVILESLKETAYDLDTSIIELVQGFGCLQGTSRGNKKMPLWSLDEIAEAIYSPAYKADWVQIHNALAWYALETVIFEKFQEKLGSFIE